MQRTRLSLAALALAACTVSHHGLPDAEVATTVDGPVTQVTIRGVVTRHDEPGTPLADVLVAANHLDDDSLAGSVLTDAAGSFSIVVQTPHGTADVYLLAKSTAAGPTLADTYYNFPGVLVGDAYAAIDAFTPAAYGALYTAAGVPASNGTMQVRARSYDGDPLAGAVVRTFSGSGAVVYDSASGQPSATAMSTGPDGLAYVLGATTDVVFVDPLGYEELQSREARVFPGAVTELELSTGPGAD